VPLNMEEEVCGIYVQYNLHQVDEMSILHASGLHDIHLCALSGWLLVCIRFYGNTYVHHRYLQKKLNQDR
jgi:hypothetical protein